MAKKLMVFPSIRVGQVIGKAQKCGATVAKVRIQDMKLDKNILMYFPCKRDKWCVDNLNTREGDIVVVKNLEERLGRLVYTKVDSVMFKVGATIDPLTGRRCRGTDFVEKYTGQKDTSPSNKGTLRAKNEVKKHKIIETEV